MQPWKASPAHPWLSPPLRQHLCAWLLSSVPRELAQLQTGECKGAHALEGAHLPVNMAEGATEWLSTTPSHGSVTRSMLCRTTQRLPTGLNPRFLWSWTHSNTALDFLFPPVLLSRFIHASRGHLPGELPEPKSFVSRLALWESPAKMSDALQGLWSGWRWRFYPPCHQIHVEALIPIWKP